jgi:hypothetical protein
MGNSIQISFQCIRHMFRMDDDKINMDKNVSTDNHSGFTFNQPCHVLSTHNEMIYLNQWITDKESQTQYLTSTLQTLSNQLKQSQEQMEFLRQEWMNTRVDLTRQITDLESRLAKWEQDDSDMVILSTV